MYVGRDEPSTLRGVILRNPFNVKVLLATRLQLKKYVKQGFYAFFISGVINRNGHSSNRNRVNIGYSIT